VERVKPAVVAIFTERMKLSIFLQPVPLRGAGSGFVFRPEGYILTNNHVVEGAEKITVSFPESPYFPEGASFPGQIIGRDPLSDLAVIKVEAQNLPTVKFGDSAKLRVGDWVIAIGNAQALPGGPTVTLGVVSALGRSISIPERGVTLYDLIQTDAAINKGNSGGPLVNLAGEVVGINTAIVLGAENIGFAIASSTALPIKDELITYGRIRWPWLGVVVTTLTPAIANELRLPIKRGSLLEKIVAGSPAHRAGLKRGDVITHLGKEETPTAKEFLKTLWKYRAGDKVEITFVRGKQTFMTQAILAERPQ
jgi:S1-C subfamily serine protease